MSGADEVGSFDGPSVRSYSALPDDPADDGPIPTNLLAALGAALSGAAVLAGAAAVPLAGDLPYSLPAGVAVAAVLQVAAAASTVASVRALRGGGR